MGGLLGGGEKAYVEIVDVLLLSLIFTLGGARLHLYFKSYEKCKCNCNFLVEIKKKTIEECKCNPTISD